MALNNNFYAEILEKEAYWIDLANKNLLNIYYLNGQNGLKQFYLSKKQKLEYEYNLTHNVIINNFLILVQNIIKEIDLLTNEFREGKAINIKELTRLFLTNQMNNTMENEKVTEVNRLQIRKQLLENLREQYIKTKDNNTNDEDYMYDDFPDQKAV